MPEVLKLISESLNVILGFEEDIRSNVNNVLAALTGAQGFVSSKSFLSLQLTEWSIKKLIDNLTSFSYTDTNFLSMMTLSVEEFLLDYPCK